MSGEGKQRVLVGERRKNEAAVLAHSLLGAGMSVAIADRVEVMRSALRAAAEGRERVDAVLLDLDLVDGSGEPVERILDECAQMDGIPVIVLGRGLTGDRAAALCDRCLCLPKPISPESLLGLLARQAQDPVVAFLASFGVSDCEAAAARLRISGATLRVIAERLGVEESTAEEFLRRVGRKTGLSRREWVDAAKREARRQPSSWPPRRR
jgi:DNA-binding response OmpR family regulator